MIGDVIDYCTQDKYVHTINWESKGDLVMVLQFRFISWYQWDNRIVMHRATNDWDNIKYRRDMRRTSNFDTGPGAWGPDDLGHGQNWIRQRFESLFDWACRSQFNLTELQTLVLKAIRMWWDDDRDSSTRVYWAGPWCVPISAVVQLHGRVHIIGRAGKRPTSPQNVKKPLWISS